MDQSYASYFLSLPVTERQSRLKTLSSAEQNRLPYNWQFWRRPNQTPPAWNWRTWLILAGRGFGKTRTGAEQVRAWVKAGYRYVNLIGATADDARDIMIEGESGILAICPKDERPVYVKNLAKLAWPNGATSLIFTADAPERLRGKQHEKLWEDELAAWRYPEAHIQAMLGMRLGDNPQTVVTTTPKPTKEIRELVNDPTTAVTRGSTYDNRSNLAPAFFDEVIKRYEGTRLGRQELNAEILDDNPDALWKRSNIDDNRVKFVPGDLERIVVGVDPSISSTGDDAGIVTAGILREHGYTLGDDSMQGSPLQWAEAAVTAYYKYQADCIIAEANQGGEMVSQMIYTVDRRVNVRLVHASRGKITRAEPIAALSEQGRDHHVGFFAALEDELCEWQPGDPSPNRMDAKVWAYTELFEGGGGVISGFNPMSDYRG